MKITIHSEEGTLTTTDICGLCLQPGATKSVGTECWPGQRQPSTPHVHPECELAESTRAFSALSDAERIEAILEEAYWRFDARRSGSGPWKGMPMSERDAFKAVLRQALI